MKRPPLVQFHVSPELHRRLQRLRSERDINLSAWLRRLVARELDREFGTEPDAAEEPKTHPESIPGWNPYSLGKDTWGACWRGDTRKLPENLLGCSIEIKTRGGDTLIRTVVEVIERNADFVLVRDSGRPSDAT